MPAQKKRASLTTLGCRLNQSETHALAEKLRMAGYEVVPFGQKSNLGIINTCTVTAQADSKCRQTIRGFIRQNPEAYTAVVGCYSQIGTAEVAEIEGVDLIVGNQEKMSVLDYVGDAQKNESPVIIREKIDKDDFTMRFAGELPFNQRANLKVQDGCDFVCSFCIIPFARGRARSRDLGDLMKEARAQCERGVRELVLTGVNIGTYHNSGLYITELVDALAELPGIARLRISSIEPTTVPMTLFDRMADPAHPLQPFLHLPLQSGSDPILKAMRRRYRVSEWLDFVEAARARIPDLYVGSDVMVGFPGETETDFHNTVDALDGAGVCFAHVFTYSEREGTLAARWTDKMLTMEERHRRSARLRAFSERLRRAFYQRYLGTEREVLFENPREDGATGLTDNYIRVRVEPPEGIPLASLTNRRATVRLSRVRSDFVEAQLTGRPD